MVKIEIDDFSSENSSCDQSSSVASSGDENIVTISRAKKSSAGIPYIARRIFTQMPNAGIYPHDLENAINKILSNIKEAIASGRRVEIRGFGSFRVRKYKGKIVSVSFHSFMK